MSTTQRTPAQEARHRQMRHLFAVSRAFMLSRGERMEVASFVLDRNITSWSELSPQDVSRMIDAVNGAMAIGNILAERKRGLRR